MRHLTIASSVVSKTSDVFVEEDIIQTNFLLDFCKKMNCRPVVITDKTVALLHGKNLAKNLQAPLLEILEGESSKTLQIVENLNNQLSSLRYGKDTVLLALGGGVVTDVVGFLASIYLRGVPLILIPTTLLGMVDAAIGGKTGIDTDFGKNLLGTIYFPVATVIDSSFLKTLSLRHLQNGLVEIMKLGLCYDASLWDLSLQGLDSLSIIEKAIFGKISIVTQDCLDHSIRKILNFGHTIGHALESSTNFQLLHGEAVAIGCLVESFLSMELGFLSKDTFVEILDGFKAFSIKLPSDYKRSHFMKDLLFDKKSVKQGIRFVVIDRIGHAVEFDGEYCTFVSDHQIQNALNWMEANFG